MKKLKEDRLWIVILFIACIVDCLFRFTCVADFVDHNICLSQIDGWLLHSFFSDEAKNFLSPMTTVISITFSVFTFSVHALSERRERFYLDERICNILGLHPFYNSRVFLALLFQIVSSVIHFYSVYYVCICWQAVMLAGCIKSYLLIIDESNFEKKIREKLDSLSGSASTQDDFNDILIYYLRLLNRRKTKVSVDTSNPFVDALCKLVHNLFNEQWKLSRSDYDNLFYLFRPIHQAIRDLMKKIPNKTERTEIALSLLAVIEDKAYSSDCAYSCVFLTSDPVESHDRDEADKIKFFTFYYAYLYAILNGYDYLDMKLVYQSIFSSREFCYYKDVFILFFFEYEKRKDNYVYLLHSVADLYEACMEDIRLHAEDMRSKFFNDEKTNIMIIKIIWYACLKQERRASFDTLAGYLADCECLFKDLKMEIKRICRKNKEVCKILNKFNVHDFFV